MLTKELKMKCSNIALYTVVTTTFFVSNLSVFANSEFAYDMSDIGALQSQYQKQLKKPKAAPTRAPAKKIARKQASRPAAKKAQSNQNFNEQIRLLMPSNSHKNNNN